MELITQKDDFKRLVTGPVAIPDCPDCDYPRGEKLLSVDEIESMVHFYNTTSQLSDEMHVYGATKQSVGVAVENWTLKEPLTTRNTQGNEVTLPRGTWMTTIKVTDDDTWQKIQDGTYKGFSASYMSREAAEEVLAAKRTLIADLEDPMPVTVSIVDEPCVFDALFCSIKKEDEGEDEVDKAGRRFSNATLKKIQGAFESLQNLINEALTERGQTEADKNVLEDIDMDEEQLTKLVREAVKAELELQRQEDEPGEEDEAVEVEEESEPEPSEAEKQLLEAQAEIEALKTKLGEGESQKIDGQDEEQTPPDESQKYRVQEGRDLRGCRI